MEEAEIPLEESQEAINHHAQLSEGRRWFMAVALSSAIFAAMAAVASLLSGHHVNEALISQIQANDQIIKASDQWAYYQAKGVKSAVLGAKIDLLKRFDKPLGAKDEEDVQRYEKDQEEIKTKAEGYEHRSERLKEEGEQHLRWHLMLARSVTMFQVSIAVAAVAVLVQKRRFWFVSLIFGAMGVCFLLQQLMAEFLKH